MKKIIGLASILLLIFLVLVSYNAQSKNSKAVNGRIGNRSKVTNQLSVYCCSNTGLVITNIRVGLDDGSAVDFAVNLTNGNTWTGSDYNWSPGTHLTITLTASQSGPGFKSICIENPWSCYTPPKETGVISIAGTQTSAGLLIDGSTWTAGCP